MREKWNKLIRDVKGAVTVFVTLLLIPAILVTGSGVDLARLYVAKSIVHDANQLAANSTLTEYDALLQDLYGLFGVCTTDPELGKMIDDYVKITVFGEEPDTSAGAFKLFDGSDLDSSDAIEVSNQNLDNVDVLRRQIEEYAKIRAPIIIAKDILGVIDKFKKIKQDAETIKTKMEIEEKIDEIDDLYKDLYKSILEFNKYPDAQSGIYSDLNKALKTTRQQLDDLRHVRDEYHIEYNSGADENKLKDLKTRYDEICANVRKTIQGGNMKTGWQDGKYDDEGEWQPGYFQGTKGVTGVNIVIRDSKEKIEGFKNLLTEIKNRAEKIESKKKELREKIEELERKMQESSSDLQQGLTAKDEKGRSVIENYKLLLEDNVQSMVNAMSDKDLPILEKDLEVLGSVFFGDQTLGLGGNEYKCTLDELEHLKSSTPGFDIEAYIGMPFDSRPKDKLENVARVNNYEYSAVAGFKEFQNSQFDSTHNAKFFDLLKEMYGSGDGKDELKKHTKELITGLFSAVQEQQKGLSFIPEGANYYKAKEENNHSSGFGRHDNWSKEGEGEKSTKNELNNSIVSKIGDLMGEAADKIILLTYDSAMFSCFTTKSGEETMAGIPMGTEVNYFFQSEMEYLYNGSNDAIVNLAAVAGMILLVRFVFNYIAAFSHSEVTKFIDGLKAALGFLGPVGVAIAEAVRLALAIGESAIDVARLRGGDKVAIIKINEAESDWRLSIKGLLDYVKDLAEDVSSKAQEMVDSAVDKETSSPIKPGDTSSSYLTMTYLDYMRIFLLFKDGDTLAQRTGELIEFNLTNYKNGINADETKMSEAALEDLSKMMTGFTITTTVNLRMLFLSLPFAQEGINGVVPPGKVAIRAVDYRGY